MYTFDEIARFAEQLFAHSASYYSPEIVAGRTDEEASIEKALGVLPRGGVVVISELLGSGKTFLLRKFGDRMQHEGKWDADEKKVHSIRNFDGNSRTGRSVVIVDEIDRKLERPELLRQLELVNEELGVAAHHMILSGDFLLKDPEVLSRLPNRTDTTPVELEGLSPDLFREAMEKRAMQYEGTREKASVINRIFDDDILNRLLPNTDPPVVTFRDVLTTLANLTTSQAWPLTTKACAISGELITQWFGYTPAVRYTPAQARFIEWLRSFIVKSADNSEPMRALTVAQLREAAPIPGIASDSDYENRVLQPLAHGGVLRGFGIPPTNGDPMLKREPEPYLPTGLTFLRAWYDDWWLDFE